MAPQAVRIGVPARVPKLRVRRNVRWLAAGILAVALGGLGTWAVFSSAVESRPALKVVNTVHRGQPIKAADLAVVPVGRNLDVPVVAADQLSVIAGQRASVDLAAGSLLVRGSYGAPDLQPGFARVGLKVEAGRIPATKLAPGTPLAVVALPAATNALSSPAPLPATVPATLASPVTVGTDGSVLIELNVPVASAEQVARLGALKQVAIMQKAS